MANGQRRTTPPEIVAPSEPRDDGRYENREGTRPFGPDRSPSPSTPGLPIP